MKLSNSFLQLYLEYIEDTESPRLMHLWSALSGASACLGRRVVLPFGIADIFANQYVLLVGPPGVRKSTAIGLMQKRLKAATNIKFAPSDTGGQRQGLIVAMEGDEDELDELAELDAADIAANLEKIAAQTLHIDIRDKHHMYVVASEFNTFIGHNALDMITFLGKMWDGEDYDYRIKAAQNTLSDPLLNLIGGTTPTNIASSMPTEAIGQGFMSRIILVFAGEKYKKVARPKQLDQKFASEIEKVYSFLYHEMEGEIKETVAAENYIDEVYDHEVKITDPRFIYYCERRQTHLLKLCMALAATRRSKLIEVSDIDDALLLLQATEIAMTDALGEYGLSPLAAAKQKMVEFLRHAKGAVTANILWAVMSRDMKQIDFLNSLADLCNADKIVKVQTDAGEAFVYKSKRSHETDVLIAELGKELVE